MNIIKESTTSTLNSIATESTGTVEHWFLESNWATYIVYRIFELLLGRVPWFIYQLLSYTFTATVTLDFWGILYLTMLIGSFGIFLTRTKLLDQYKRLTPTVTVARNEFDLKPDTTIEEARSPAYPDDFMNAFLSSIKVFGYLDKPVFHELAKSLETKFLEQGEVLFDVGSEDRDFYIVVDGQIDLFIKNNGHDDSDYSDDEEIKDEFVKHHMLNNVKAGGTVTSLFSILSILSEDMVLPAKLVPVVSDSNGEKIQGGTRNIVAGDVTPSSSKMSHDIPLPFKEGAFVECESLSETESIAQTSASGNTVNSKDIIEGSELKANRKMSEDSKTSSSTRKQKKERKHKSVHPNLVARASKATKLAVIPATAFQKLAEKFPNSAAHMVQVILTRFQRVTFMTLHKYLGLSGELLAIERNLNEISGSGLPADRFPHDQLESIFWRLSHQHSADLPPNLSHSRTSSKKPLKVNQSPGECSDEDLGFSDIQRNQREFLKDFKNGRPFIAGDEDEILKDSVFNCMAQLIGLTPSKEPNVKEPVVRRNSLRSPQNNPINSSIERFYYGKNKSFNNSPSRSFYDADDISVVSSSMASSVGGDIGADNLDIPEVELLFFKQGELLLKEGDRSNGLYFVLEGTIEASTSPGKDLMKEYWKSSRSPRRKKKDVFLIQPGSLAGYLSAFTGNPSFVTLKAKTDLLVGLMPKIVLERYGYKYPNILLCLAKRLVNQLSPLVFHIDFALEWAQINAGQSLCLQGDKSHSIFIVLTGRLRSIKDNADSDSASFEIMGEHGPSESVGELEVLIDAPRPATIHAIRDSEVAIMPKSLFNALAAQHPEIMMTISRMIALRSKRFQDNPKTKTGSNNENLKTVAFLPVSKDVPILEFAENLQSALDAMGARSRFLDTRSITSQLGRHAFTKLGRLKLISWLAEQEENHRLVMYIADGGVNSPWTQRCIRQADCIIVIGCGDGDPNISEYEQLLLSMKTTARKELVLLHPTRFCTPGSTARWLKLRLWIHAHHHIQMKGVPGNNMKPMKINTTTGNLGDHFSKFISDKSNPKTLPQDITPNIFSGSRSDFSRLARRLLSRSIGLVLGGGGAKGLSHAGIIRAFEENGLPFDYIGGTSMGAFVGGVYARENDHVSVYGRTKNFCRRMCSTWRMAIDLTYPVVSITSGHEFNMCVWKAFFDTQIEDCWLPFFAISTNITYSRMEVSQQGYMWRYIRSSMSLSGFVPPLCDNGSMLMDGGYLNNVPADVMRDLGAKYIVAIDVGSAENNNPATYGDTLSGWWVLFNSYNPFSKDYGEIPTLQDIQSKLAYASSVPLREQITKMEGCHYLRPPILNYKTMDFAKFKEIEQVGYEYGKKIIQEWNEKGILAEQFGIKLAKSTSYARRASV